MKKIKVKCLVNNVWHTGGRIVEGEVVEVLAEDAAILTASKQVQKQPTSRARKKVQADG